MKQEFSLAHLTVLGCAPPEMVYIAARAGYDYVSIRPIYMGLPNEPNYALADNPQMLKQTKHALATTGVRLHDIELARVYEGLHPTKYLPAMEVAAELGGKAVLSSIWGGEREFYIEKFGEICDLAKPFGLTVDLEYVPIAAVANLAQAVDVLRAVDRSSWSTCITSTARATTRRTSTRCRASGSTSPTCATRRPRSRPTAPR
jgi:sugar phosphate isomerase/epimerase